MFCGRSQPRDRISQSDSVIVDIIVLVVALLQQTEQEEEKEKEKDQKEIQRPSVTVSVHGVHLNNVGQN